MVTAAGSYRVSLLQLTGSQSSQAVLAFNVTIEPAPADPWTSFISGGGLTSAIVGQPANFTVCIPFLTLQLCPHIDTAIAFALPPAADAACLSHAADLEILFLHCPSDLGAVIQTSAKLLSLSQKRNFKASRQ